TSRGLSEYPPEQRGDPEQRDDTRRDRECLHTRGTEHHLRTRRRALLAEQVIAVCLVVARHRLEQVLRPIRLGRQELRGIATLGRHPIDEARRELLTQYGGNRRPA